MDGGMRGIDPLKIQTIRECLDKQFLGVKFSQTIRPTFIFHNGVPKLPWLLVINAEFLADRMSIEEVRRFMLSRVGGDGGHWRCRRNVRGQQSTKRVGSEPRLSRLA